MGAPRDLKATPGILIRGHTLLVAAAAVAAAAVAAAAGP